jgi:regulator of nucleoside diphosphate kinase
MHAREIDMTETFHKPSIAISQSDFARLSRLAEALARSNSELAEQLSSELVRAEVMDDSVHEREVVRMGSTLEYETESGSTRTVTLVFPQDEDISSGRVSILTPIGVALIGLSAGDSMTWRKRDGGVQRLKIVRLLKPALRRDEADLHGAMA